MVFNGVFVYLIVSVLIFQTRGLLRGQAAAAVEHGATRLRDAVSATSHARAGFLPCDDPPCFAGPALVSQRHLPPPIVAGHAPCRVPPCPEQAPYDVTPNEYSVNCGTPPCAVNTPAVFTPCTGNEPCGAQPSYTPNQDPVPGFAASDVIPATTTSTTQPPWTTPSLPNVTSTPGTEVTATSRGAAIDCSVCARAFGFGGGCVALSNGTDASEYVPPGCGICNDTLTAFCGTSTAAPVAYCEQCARDFGEAGGCDALRVGKDLTEYIPDGCEQCESEAAQYCQSLEPCAGNETAVNKTCDICAMEFGANGGCAAVQRGAEPWSFVPKGCEWCAATVIPFCATSVTTTSGPSENSTNSSDSANTTNESDSWNASIAADNQTSKVDSASTMSQLFGLAWPFR